MKRTGLIITAVIVAIVVIFGVKAYNGMVTGSQGVDAAWANVETQYQRRADLIPNLVSTVKGYAAHEQQTLEDVVAARAAATAITLDGSSMTPAQFEEYVAAQNKVTSALGRLIAVAENYPDLKAHREIADAMQQNMYLQREITAARELYNDTINEWNRDIFAWPTKMIVAAKNGYTTRIPFSISSETKAQARGVFF